MKVERPFIALGSPRGIALTSLDKYIEQKKQEMSTSTIPQEFPVNDKDVQIASLQKEQSRLCEELNAERRRSENLKTTFSRALALASSQQKDKLSSIKRILLNAPQKSQVIQLALKYIQDIETQDSSVVPDAPKLSELTQVAKEAELSGEKEAKLNRALKKKYAQVKEEKDDVKKEVEIAKQNLEKVTEDRRALKEKCKSFVENVRKREAQWKERYAALQAELEALH